MPPSVFVLTLNEESNLEACLASVDWADDIVVLDSYSTDGTCALAEKLGARVFHRHFDNWAAHQNWALRNISFRNPWVFYIDADERCDDVLRDELLQIDRLGEGVSAFQIRRKDYFMGRWLKRSQFYPTWITRIFRPEKIEYTRPMHTIANVDGVTATLEGHLIHYPFSHGIAHWYNRHNKYSDFEAELLDQEITGPNDWKGMISRDAKRRRKALKRFAYGMPLRPCLTFLYLFFVRWAFLDGMPGINYSLMRSSYEYMIDLKFKELCRRRKGLPV